MLVRTSRALTVTPGTTAPLESETVLRRVDKPSCPQRLVQKNKTDTPRHAPLFKTWEMTLDINPSPQKNSASEGRKGPSATLRLAPYNTDLNGNQSQDGGSGGSSPYSRGRPDPSTKSMNWFGLVTVQVSLDPPGHIARMLSSGAVLSPASG